MNPATLALIVAMGLAMASREFGAAEAKRHGGFWSAFSYVKAGKIRFHPLIRLGEANLLSTVSIP